MSDDSGEAAPAADEVIAAQLLESAHAIHDALNREANSAARERAAAKERAKAKDDRLKHQTRAAQLLAALNLGPNFPSILSQVME